MPTFAIDNRIEPDGHIWVEICGDAEKAKIKRCVSFLDGYVNQGKIFGKRAGTIHAEEARGQGQERSTPTYDD